jgi:hypothetical protein
VVSARLWLDMDRDVRQMKAAPQKAIFYAMRNVVAFADRALTGHSDVNVGKAHQATLPYAALFHAGYALDRSHGPKNFSDHFRRGLCVQNFADGGSQHAPAIKDDHTT